MSDILKIAKDIQYNASSEAHAIEDYTELLKMSEESNLDEADKSYVRAVIEEIIADELNHQQRLQALYSALTEIQAKKD